jgi:type IV pilus assembly protein PilW
MKTTYKSQSKSKGLTLIEILIALVIGSLLMVGAMGLFMSNKRVYKEQDSMGRLQENARFALDLMISDIRRAGYVGCSDALSTVTNTLTNSGTATNLINITNAVEGSEAAANWVPSASTEAIASILPIGGMQTRPDAITLRYLLPIEDNISMSAAMADGAAGTVIPVTCSPTADCTVDGSVIALENMAISDCSSTDIFSISTVTAGSLAHAGVALTKGYDSTSQISRYVTNRYFVGNGANDRTGNAIPTLFRYTFAQDKDDSDSDTNTAEFLAFSQPLVEGIENIQILYGVDTAGSDSVADSYVNAAGVGNWNNVVSVKLSILARTVEQNFSGEIDSKNYELLGTDIYTGSGPGDYHRRRIFSATIQIRNRSS